MTGRTHDLAALTALNIVFISQPPSAISVATAFGALGACFMGGLAPDLDKSTSDFWDKIPAGSILGKLISPLIGTHRHISHSLIGLIIFGVGIKYLLNVASGVVLINMDIVWFSFMIGIVSHLIMDTLTTEGVPWLFPLPFHIGFPPFREYRVKTGGVVEKFVIFPLLLITNGYLFYNFYTIYLKLLKTLIK
jgi:inner membrane protein